MYSGLEFKIRYEIMHKLKDIGAVCREEAVTPEVANLNVQETYWLKYFAGGVLSTIVRTKDGRYYTRSD